MNERTHILLTVLVDVSCMDASNVLAKERLALLKVACNSYLEKLQQAGVGHNVVMTTATFSDGIIEHAQFNDGGHFEFALVENKAPDWEQALTWTLDTIHAQKQFFDLCKIAYFPPLLLFFSATPPKAGYSEVAAALRNAQAKGDIIVKAVGIGETSDALALSDLTDDIVLPDAEDKIGWKDQFRRTTIWIQEVLDGLRPFDTAAVKRAFNSALDALSLQAGVPPEKVIAQISLALRRSGRYIRNKLLVGLDTTFDIYEARDVVKVLNSLGNKLPMEYRSFAEGIAVQYRAASSARIPAEPKAARAHDSDCESARDSGHDSAHDNGHEGAHESYAEDEAAESAKQALGKQDGKRRQQQPDGAKTMDLPLEGMTKSELELAALIGLEEVKVVVRKIVALAKLNKRYRRRSKSRPTYLHMAFLGNPGTAKTTVARLLAKILYEHGILRKAEIVEVGRDGLVGKYVGSTAPKVVAAFDKARGSILFIDEAYSLNDSGHGDYGDEALGTIVNEMENRRGDPIVIMAGYPGEMGALLYQNAGLKSRIKFIVNFADYTDDELYRIVEHTAKQYGYALKDGVREKVMPMIADAKHDETFGNGRWARNLIEQAELNLAERLIKLSIDEIDDTLRDTLLAEDFEAPATITFKQKKQQIGFMPQSHKNTG